MWSVVDAKARLSELLRRARAGEPQFVGTRDPCVIVSAEHYRERIKPRGHDGRWLIDQAARLGFDIPLPSRRDDRPDPDWTRDA
jgi:prevent-host-death family protein